MTHTNKTIKRHKEIGNKQRLEEINNFFVSNGFSSKKLQKRMIARNQSSHFVSEWIGLGCLDGIIGTVAGDVSGLLTPFN